jgi:hypothetical protein
MKKIEEIKKYDTLERRMKKEFILDSKKIFDINNLDRKMKELIKDLKEVNWDNVEHFEIGPSKDISDSEIDKLIEKHYSQKGYHVSPERTGIFIAEKEKDSLLINISNLGNRISANVAILFPVA